MKNTPPEVINEKKPKDLTPSTHQDNKIAKKRSEAKELSVKHENLYSKVISYSNAFHDNSEYAFINHLCRSSDGGILIALHNHASLFKYNAELKSNGKMDLKKDEIHTIDSVFMGDNHKTYICGSNNELCTLYIYNEAGKKIHENPFPKKDHEFRYTSVSPKDKIYVTEVISNSIFVFDKKETEKYYNAETDEFLPYSWVTGEN